MRPILYVKQTSEAEIRLGRAPAFNVCPTQKVAAIRPTADTGRHALVPLK